MPKEIFEIKNTSKDNLALESYNISSCKKCLETKQYRKSFITCNSQSHIGKYKKGKDLDREKCKKVKSSRTYFCMLMDQYVAKPFVKSHDVNKHDATSGNNWY